MVKEVIKKGIVDKIWGDISEDRGMETRHHISDEDWCRLRVYLEIAYEAGFKEGIEQEKEDSEWYKGFEHFEPPK